MGKVIYDFRDGLDSEKIVYKESGTNWKEGFYYFGYLMLTWGWAVGFFALFQYAYLTHREIAFWTYIGIWGFFMLCMLTVITINLCIYYSNKSKRAKQKGLEEHIKLEKEKKDREEREMKRRTLERPGNDYALTTQNNYVETAKLNN